MFAFRRFVAPLALSLALAGCSSPNKAPVEVVAQAPDTSPPPPAHAAEPEVRATPPAAHVPRLRQGSSPVIELTSQGRLGALDAAGLRTAREVVIHIAGPQSVTRRHFLAFPAERDCPPERVCHYDTSPFPRQTANLGRHLTLGTYTVTATSPAGLALTVSPARYEIVPGLWSPTARLPREPLAIAGASESVAIMDDDQGVIVVDDAGRPSYIDARHGVPSDDTPRFPLAVASSGTHIAAAYTGDNANLSLAVFDHPITRTTSVVLDRKSRLLQLLSDRDRVRVAWNPKRREWLAAWLSLEAPTTAEARAIARRHNWIPLEIEVLRLARISAKGKLLRTTRVRETHSFSNPVGHGSTHAMAAIRRPYLGQDRTRPAQVTLMHIRRARVVRQKRFAIPPTCRWLDVADMQLAWNGTVHAVAIHDRHSEHTALWNRQKVREVPRISVFHLGQRNPVPVEVAAHASRDIGSVQFAAIDGQWWLVYESIRLGSGRVWVVAALLDRDLSVTKTLLLDDGFDDVSALHLFASNGRLKVAIARASGASVVSLPSAREIGSLAELDPAEVSQPTSCLPAPAKSPAQPARPDHLSAAHRRPE